MKYFLVGCAAVVLTAFAVAMRAPERTVVRERQVEVPVRVEVPIEVPVERRVVEERVIERTVEVPSPPRSISNLPRGVLLAQSNMLFLFEREVGITRAQRAEFMSILKDRQGEIDSYQAEVVASGVLQTAEYDHRINGIQQASYRRMAQALTIQQRPPFWELIAQGQFGDAVEFDLPESLVVVR